MSEGRQQAAVETPEPEAEAHLQLAQGLRQLSDAVASQAQPAGQWWQWQGGEVGCQQELCSMVCRETSCLNAQQPQKGRTRRPVPRLESSKSTRRREPAPSEGGEVANRGRHFADGVASEVQLLH